MNWKALKEVPPGQPGFPRGTCESCGLSIWSEGAYKITGIKGYFCSVLCFECHLFGNGKCRLCGEKLGSGAQKFCSESHRKQSNETRFGDGVRLLSLLSAKHPKLYQRLVSREDSLCLTCNDSLDSKRNGARFCDDRCRKRYLATSPTLPKTGINAETPQQNQQVTDHESRSGTLALVG